MTVLYLHQYFNTPDMQGGTRSYEMARRLVGKGHRVIMLTTETRAYNGVPWRTSVEDGIEVHWYRNRYSNHMGYIRRMWAFIRFAVGGALRAIRQHADVVLATSTPLTVAIPGIIASRVNRIPFVFEVRDLWPDVPIALGAIRSPILIRASRWLEVFAYRNATRVVTLAPGMGEHVIAKGVSADRIDVIPNGCDSYLFGAASGDPSPRERFGWLRERPLVLYAGAIGLVNGVDYIVRLAAEVEKERAGVRFAIVGDGRMLRSVTELASQLGVLGRNLFMLGRMSKREVAQWFRSCDATIVTYSAPEICLRNTVQNKFFDSLAAGKPVFAEHDGFSTRLAKENGCGVLLPKDDLPEAARVVVTTLENSAWLREASEHARRLAETTFSRDRLAIRLENCLLASVAQWRMSGARENA